MHLTENEYNQLESALRDAFTSYSDLGNAARRAGFRISDATSDGPWPTVVRLVIEYAESRDMVTRLVSVARAENPRNADLFKVSAALGLEPGDPLRGSGDAAGALARTTGRLERMVDPDRGIRDLGFFAARIQELIGQVCRVELGNERGTGFLIGPDTVLTNHHVVATAIRKEFDPTDIVVRFDHHRLRDGVTVSGGKIFGLAENWLVDAEDYSQTDLVAFNAATSPADHELDYAILRLDNSVGDQRGWVVPPKQTYGFPPGSFLMVVQHPCLDPIAYDYLDDAVVRLNGNGTRVHYRNNTLPGSSGSPVFDRNLDLVALHHAGEPGAPDQFLPCHEQVAVASYNEGIPIARIVAHVQSKGLGWAFGGERAAADAVEGPLAPRNDANVLTTNGLPTLAPREPEQANIENASSNLVAPFVTVNAQTPESRVSMSARANVADAPRRPASTLMSPAAVNPSSGGRAGDDTATNARRVRLGAVVEVLESLRRLMEDALSRFGSMDAGGGVAEMPHDSDPQSYVESAEDLYAKIAEASLFGTSNQGELLQQLHGLVAVVLAGMRAAEQDRQFDTVAILSTRAAGAYEMVGSALEEQEQGQIFQRVAPYWSMKAAHATYQQKRAMAAHVQSPVGQNPLPRPPAGTFDR